MSAIQSEFYCPTCQAVLRPLKTDPTLGFLCYGCPAIVTVYPGGGCRIREVWSGREFDCRLESLRHPSPSETTTRPAYP